MRWTWADKDAVRDSFAEIEVEYADGHREIHSPGDFPDASEQMDRGTDRLMGGPYDTKVYAGESNKRVTPRCDVCNRKLAQREPWWMVHSPTRGWESNAGVVCGMHHPDRLPTQTATEHDDSLIVPCPHCPDGTLTTVQDGTTGLCDTCGRTVNLSPTQTLGGEAAMTKPEQDLVALLDKTGGRVQVAGIVECRAALALAGRGTVRIESGDITPEGGSGWVASV